MSGGCRDVLITKALWLQRLDLNQRPLGYEGKFARNTEQRQPIKPKKTLSNPTNAVGSLWATLAAIHVQKTDRYAPGRM
jgi:hypothetical protein